MVDFSDPKQECEWGCQVAAVTVVRVCLQVADSGKPQLVSTAFVSVRVIEESVHPPSILPLDIFIATHGDEYPGGVLGKIHATDQDVYDTLTYSLASPGDGLFTVSAGDGKVIARQGLDPGHYPLNVTVTDGRFAAAAGVSVHVRQVTRQALEHSLAVRFASVAPEEFVGDYWRTFLRALRNIAGVRRSDVQLVSLQPSEPPGADLDVLLALEKAGSPYQTHELLFRKLNASAAVIEVMTGLRIVRVVRKLCAGLDCPLHFCEEAVTLEPGSLATYSTARLSFVTPRHQRTAVCLCKGTALFPWSGGGGAVIIRFDRKLRLPIDETVGSRFMNRKLCGGMKGH